MNKFLAILVFITLSAFANEQCKVVNGFNLCDDANVIANNTKSDIGIKRNNSKYILKSVHAENMTVISVNENIYTKEEITQKLKIAITLDKSSAITIDEMMGKIKDDATKRLCGFYRNDVFVKDGGSFKVSYSYKNGDIFHTVLAEKNNCREID